GLAALDDPVHTQLSIPVAPALAGDAVAAVKRQGIFELARDPMHLRILDEGPFPGDLVTPVESGQNLDRAHHATPVIRQPDGVLGGRPAHEFRLPGGAEVATLRLPKDVVGGAHTPRSPAAEAAQPAIHQPGVDLPELSIANAPAVECARAIVLH